jgi:alkylhydroperoxidase family enzyme
MARISVPEAAPDVYRALAHAEAATERPSGVSDEIWDAVTAHFKQEEAAYLVAQVAMINAWNRIAAPPRTPPPERS